MFANNVEDSAILLREIAGYDDKDSTSANVKIPNYYENLNCDVKDKIIGIPEEYNLPNIPDEIKEMWENAKKLF